MKAAVILPHPLHPIGHLPGEVEDLHETRPPYAAVRIATALKTPKCARYRGWIFTIGRNLPPDSQ